MATSARFTPRRNDHRAGCRCILRVHLEDKGGKGWGKSKGWGKGDLLAWLVALLPLLLLLLGWLGLALGLGLWLGRFTRNCSRTTRWRSSRDTQICSY